MEAWVQGTEGKTPVLHGGSGAPGAPWGHLEGDFGRCFWRLCFIAVSDGFFYRFLCPTCVQLGLQNRPKSVKNRRQDAFP